VQQQNTKTSRWWSQMLQRHFLSLSHSEEHFRGTAILLSQFFLWMNTSQFIVHHQQFA
jgi:hypothetical protein